MDENEDKEPVIESFDGQSGDDSVTDEAVECIYPLPLRFSQHCPYCDIFFRDVFSMELHDLQVHQKILNPLVCMECKEIFEISSQYMSHIADEHGSDGSESEDIDSIEEDFLKRRPLNETTSLPAKSQIFVCGKCLEKFTSKQDQLRHSAERHGAKILRCDKCPYVAKGKSSLTEHQTSHSDDRPFICDTDGCWKGYRTKKVLSRHKREVHLKTPFKCNCCDFECNAMIDLTRHKTIHDNSRLFKCQTDGCEYSAKTANEVRRHSKVHLKNSNLPKDRKYICDISGCLRRYKTPTLLQQHKLTHENRFVCRWPGCQFRCNTFAKLNDHKREESHMKGLDVTEETQLEV